MKAKLLPFALFFGLFLFQNLAFSATIQSSGSGSYWEFSNVWVGGVVPGAGDDVIIRAGHSVSLRDARSCQSLTIASTGSLNIQITGTLANTSTTVAGLLSVFGGISMAQPFVISTGGVINFGAGTRTAVAGTSFSGDGTLKISNPASLGSVLNFEAGSSCTSKLTVDGGIVNDNVGLAPGAFELRSFSVFQGSGSPVFANGFFWYDGEFAGSGSITLTGTATFGPYAGRLKGSKNFRLGTTVTTNTTFSLQEDAKMEIMSGGHLTAAISSGPFQGIGASNATNVLTIHPGGIFTKTGVGEYSINCGLAMLGGEINVNGGSLGLKSTFSKSISGGTVTTAAGATFALFSTVTCVVSGSAVFAGTGTLDIQANSIFEDNVGLTHSGPVNLNMLYRGSGSPVFAGGLNWVQGQIQGSGTATVSGPLTASGSGLRYINDSKKVLVTGAATFTNGGVSFIGDAAVFEVGPTGTVEANLAAAVSWGGTGLGKTVIAGGTFTKMGAGALNLTSSLDINGGGGLFINPGGGSIKIEPNSNAQISNWNGATIIVNLGSTFSPALRTFNVSNTDIQGQGSLVLGTASSGGTINFGANTHIDIAQTHVQSATATFNAGSSMSSTVTLSGNSGLTLVDNVGLNPGGMTTFLNGSWNGTGNTSFGAGLNWSGGYFGGSGYRTIGAGTFTVSGSAVRGLRNSATLVLLVAGNLSGRGLDLLNTSQFIIEPGGLLAMNLTSTVAISGASTAKMMLLGGSLTKTGAGSITFPHQFILEGGSANLSSGGKITLASGVSQIWTGGSLALGAAFEIISNTTVVAENVAFSGSSQTLFVGNGTTNGFLTLNSGCTITSKLQLNSGTLNDNVGILPGAVTMTGPNTAFNIAAGKTALFSNGFSWSNGAIGGAGTLQVLAATILNALSPTVKNDAILDFYGASTFQNGSFNLENNATANVTAGATVTFDFVGPPRYILGAANTLFTVLEGGSLVKTAANGTLDIRAPFKNDGSVSCAGGSIGFYSLGEHLGNFSFTGSTLSYFLDAGKNSILKGNLQNTGTLQIETGGKLRFSGTTTQTFSGNGSSTGDFELDNPNGLWMPNFQNINGTFTLTNGNISLINNGELKVNSILNFSPDRFVVTSSFGKLRMPVGASTATFPIGETASSYNPVQISQPSGTDIYSCKVQNVIDPDKATGLSNFVLRQWDISRSPSNINGADVALVWNSATDEIGDVDLLSCAVAHWNPTWTSLGGGEAACSGDFCSRSATGVTAFSPFIVIPVPCGMVATVSPTSPPAVCAPSTVLLTASPSGGGQTFQWKKDGTDILNAMNSTFSATESGAYTVVVTETPTCTDESDAVNVVVNAPTAWFADVDGDGAGDPAVLQMACSQPSGFVSNSNDGCPNDAQKVAPGLCGCGVLETDSDGDGTPNCNDLCPNDAQKVAPGICGCGVLETDSDGDGTPNCNDLCPNDAQKVAPGQCGCGVLDSDSDGDGTPNCNDGCPNDPLKIAAGVCGCGIPEGTCGGQPPVVACPTNQAFSTDLDQCTTTWTMPDPITNGNGTAFWSLAFSGNSNGLPTPQSNIANGSASAPIVFQKGSTTVTVTATNGASPVTCAFSVSVSDQTPPVALCKTTPIEVILAQNTTILPALIDNGSRDNCLVVSKTVSPTTVNCSNIGPKIITLTVVDAAGNSAQCTSIIQVSPPPSVLSMADKTVVEGSSSGVTPVQFAVVRSNNLCPASVDFSTVNATASAPGDFTQKVGTLNFWAGSFSQQIPISVKKDAIVELTESFELVLTNPVNATFGDDRAVCTITNDDETEIKVVNASSMEGNIATKQIIFTASMTKKADVPVSFLITPTDGTATLLDNDFVATSNTATIAAGQNSVQFSVFAKGDLKVEPNETVIVQLQNLQASGRAVTIIPSCVGTITNDDGSAMVAPGSGQINLADVEERDEIDRQINLAATEIALFPNPTSGFLNVFLPEGNWELTVFDLFEKVLFEKTEAEKGVFQIDAGPFSTGVYFLKAENLAQPEGSKTLRFVKTD